MMNRRRTLTSTATTVLGMGYIAKASYKHRESCAASVSYVASLNSPKDNGADTTIDRQREETIPSMKTQACAKAVFPALTTTNMA